MPARAPHPCAAPSCPALTHARYCPTHAQRAQQVGRMQDRARGTAAARGYNSRWQRYRLVYLAAHPLCATCAHRDRVTAATVVDHIQPHRGDHKLFWGPANHQALCQPCHHTKTAREDGGFGNAQIPAAPAAANSLR